MVDEIGAQLSQQGIRVGALLSPDLNQFGVLNSLPLPLLDGWQMMMLAISPFRASVSERIQMAFVQSGFLLWWGSRLY